MTFDLDRRDTICALATANAPAAIAVVRVSGPDADAVRAAVFAPRHPPQRPFVATLGDVLDAHGVLDEALCTAFLRGHSYTGEQGFELSLHGGSAVVKAVLARLRDAGCRMAEPGEFTLRAVLSGRMALPEAEAVDDIIHARSEAGMRAAQRLLHGGLQQALEEPRAAVVDVLAELEARLDFPDEDLGAARAAELLATLKTAEAALVGLLATATRGDRLRRGARVVLFGPPNAGKSTLMNALLGEERALVHHEPGTTRDVLEAALELSGMEVTLVDVAGVRAHGEAGEVERQGMARAVGERQRADLVLALAPANDAAALKAARALPGAVVVATKTDLAAAPPDAVGVCAPDGVGLTALRALMAERLGAAAAHDGEVVLMRERHVLSVQQALAGVLGAQAALQQALPHELVASELRSGMGALDRLLGRDVGAEVLDAVFARFCLGK